MGKLIDVKLAYLCSPAVMDLWMITWCNVTKKPNSTRNTKFFKKKTSSVIRDGLLCLFSQSFYFCTYPGLESANRITAIV